VYSSHVDSFLHSTPTKLRLPVLEEGDAAEEMVETEERKIAYFSVPVNILSDPYSLQLRKMKEQYTII